MFLYKTVHRDRLECSFGAVCQGKTGIFTGFSWEVLKFPLDILGFPPGINPAQSRKKSGTTISENCAERKYLKSNLCQM